MPCRIPPDELPSAPTLMITSESPTHVVIAVEIEIDKAVLTGYRRLFEQLIEAANERESRR